MRLYRPPPPGQLDHELIWGVTGLSGLVAARLLPWWSAFYPAHACLFLLSSGHPCFLCGGSRAVHLLTHGQWIEAFVLNPLAGAVGAGTALYVLYAAAALTTGRRWRPRRPPRLALLRALALLAVGLIALNWLYMVWTWPY